MATITNKREINSYNVKQCWDWLDKNAKVMPELNEHLTSLQLTDIANVHLKYKITHEEFMAASVDAGYSPKRIPETVDLWYLNIEIKA